MEKNNQNYQIERSMLELTQNIKQRNTAKSNITSQMEVAMVCCTMFRRHGLIEKMEMHTGSEISYQMNRRY